MFLDPEVVPRAVDWRDANGVRIDSWGRVLDSVALPDSERARFAGELRAFADTVGRLPEIARNCDVDATVLERCRQSIDQQASQLATLGSATLKWSCIFKIAMGRCPKQRSRRSPQCTANVWGLGCWSPCSRFGSTTSLRWHCCLRPRKGWSAPW
jgi:hypothetical protein